jgi:hypothetical protein
MTAPIEDVSSLPGKKVSDQEQTPIGEIKDIYAIGGDGHPMWVTVEARSGMGQKKTVFIPIARLKVENDELLVPYSKSHIEDTPEVDAEEGITPECERNLRDHYGIDRADQELRGDNDSYATLVPEDEEGTAQRAEDPDKLDTPDANKVSDETKSRLEDVGSAETRKVTADDVTDGEGEGGSEDQAESKEEDPKAEESKDEEPKGGESKYEEPRSDADSADDSQKKEE